MAVLHVTVLSPWFVFRKPIYSGSTIVLCPFLEPEVNLNPPKGRLVRAIMIDWRGCCEHSLRAMDHVHPMEYEQTPHLRRLGKTQRITNM